MAGGLLQPWDVGLFPEGGQLQGYYDSNGSRAIPALKSRFKHRLLEDPPSSNVGRSPISGFGQPRSSTSKLYEKSTGKRHLGSHDSAAFTALLRACTKKKDLSQGMRIHDVIQQRGLLKECSDGLVIFYAKCDQLSKAKELLYIHQCKTVFPWNALIVAYARKDEGYNAFNVFRHMQEQGLSPNAVTYSGILKACGCMRAVDKGQQFHDEIVRQGLLAKDIVLGNALVDMYVKCGALLKAHRVLKELPSRDVVSWNTLISGYAQNGQGEQALTCFEQMQEEDLTPNEVTFTCILKVCGMLEASKKGEWIHDQISKQGLLRDNITLATALIDMYAKCGALAKAKQVLEELPDRDTITWNALIVGYTRQGQGEEALECYERMQNEGLSPDAVTFSGIVKACGSIGALEKGGQIHQEISRRGVLQNNVVVGNALVGMYVNCRALEKAKSVLQELPQQDVVTWNTYMAGLVQEGRSEQVLTSFDTMQGQGLSPTPVTLTCILKACGLLGAVDRGKQIHDEISRQGLLCDNVMLGTAVVDMYAKCGALAKAAQVLEDLPFRDTVTWNALIAGYAQQGLCDQVLECFMRMQDEHCLPDAVTFACALSACNHLGLLEDGFTFFEEMSTKYGIKQGIEHYTCMIDLFGRTGHLDKAVKMIQVLPSHDDSAVWSALLDACIKWGDVNVGKWALKRAVLVDESDAAAYVLMANLQGSTDLPVDAM
ncbi:hypothetical protein GOP47_0010993 [Adiantum capillus-veneris]|uniref:Pentatricopeptide repeat-containing protein n=1 Tax=Adiantum capillus-veneris TaxID=13818 RepID=A0A9D4UWG2_ADICA|nr:hypothetical protein GOP47_0010993 [Adiantum capillus-veneris]